ncbi:3-oxoadipate enol-lactonase [Ottowia testudinis]|uniref:3-oxoadipate enol-lactonase n=1 Tax=Ottowia testudinis TaxID=2816950 RepID=A0A975H298_9BURK|nr:3-oxoadipate enol-lactonase [Ottowia testudinis]QTD44643.1 3-oxoadipate enol-lactonase [Ottowia testudinis]
MPIAPTAPARLNYELHGAPDAPLLILAHSLGSDLSMWDEQADALAAYFRVLRYDARGHGRSGAPPGPYTLPDMGQDVIALMDHLQAPRAHFCGLSMGGLVGQWLALHHPRRLSSLAACNTAARVGTAQGWAGRAAQVQQLGMPALAAQVVPRWFSPDFAQAAPARMAALQAVFSDTPAHGYIATCQALAEADLRGRLGEIATPTLVVGGTHDLSTPPAQAHELAHGIAGAELVLLPTGHLSNVEQPADFNAALLAFLQQAGEGATR